MLMDDDGSADGIDRKSTEHRASGVASYVSTGCQKKPVM